ncbi:divalent-cation tolerance protein CutA [Rhodoblastus acidophilus]|uniref:Divalent-cation tolerance protein CutA n=1 Tax=Candidatus Rhodoblastus alkanivorans TaxID=2954117 RepID=A0ABS9ZAV2_9HYPH|nr:divalent-cation tolerance protein CutA [Candidatus Rhodoblastus alkanivorans]MCI4679362.1 divalent-cation tolerance protein CutA [Candidatus Rhodoblastus alkanivorans]MCI4684838.1 divalent-cation tolerance protein CutA [Candidatus Rhodoblastus alkanivorans]MDI4642162.1 divalent-cation tolerance protein CutA [Rhodoblastus acidophilus]
MDLSAFCMVQTTIDDELRAHDIAEALIEQKLAACVQIAPVTSVYVWKGAPASEKEFLISAKARTADFAAVAAAIRELHSYETPEIIALPILTGDAAYLDWARQATERGE